MKLISAMKRVKKTAIVVTDELLKSLKDEKNGSKGQKKVENKKKKKE